jgi:predicted NAD/FAD-binding protein
MWLARVKKTRGSGLKARRKQLCRLQGWRFQFSISSTTYRGREIMKIAVIGTGIAGMTVAYLLSPAHEITVYESNDYIGGHTRTVDVPINGHTYAVDTGFIVFNEKTYTHFIQLMRKLNIGWKDSDMSFSVQCARTGLEFRPSTLNTLFAQRRNLLRPSFYRMVLDAFRFKKESQELFETDRDYTQTLDEFLAHKKYSRAFIENFIIPMGEAIWSTDPVKFREFPARYFAEFFKNHGFLNVKDQPRWLVIQGGSRQYVAPLTRRFRDRIRLNCPVESVRRHADRVEIKARGHAADTYDQVVIAAHSDQALAMLADPSERERDILGAIAYQENETVLHTDASVLPKKRAAWASWNYHIPKEERGRVAITYDMNILQGLHAPVEFCVSLNYPEALALEKVIQQMVYHHPVYTPKSLAARQRYAEINGQNRTFYCGAYWYYGFHEDGVKSALAVGKHFGKGSLD